MTEIEEKITRDELERWFLMFISAKTGMLDVDALVDFFIVMLKDAEYNENNN